MKTQNIAAQKHAGGFLLPVSPSCSVRRIAKKLLAAANTDERIASRFDEIQKKLGDGKPLIGDEHSALFDRIKSPELIPDIPTAPEWLRPLLAVGYLRAKSALSFGKGTNLFGDLESTLDKISQALDTQLEQDFIGELLTETVLAARDDNEFANVLEEGAAEFRALVNEVYGSNDGSRFLARAASNSGSNGSCQACRTVDGVKHCEPISCWIIVVIVIIIVVAK